MRSKLVYVLSLCEAMQAQGRRQGRQTISGRTFGKISKKTGTIRKNWDENGENLEEKGNVGKLAPADGYRAGYTPWASFINCCIKLFSLLTKYRPDIDMMESESDDSCTVEICLLTELLYSFAFWTWNLPPLTRESCFVNLSTYLTLTMRQAWADNNKYKTAQNCQKYQHFGISWPYLESPWEMHWKSTNMSGNHSLIRKYIDVKM